MASRQQQTLSGRALRRMTPLLRHLDVNVSRWSNSYAYHRTRYLRDMGITALVDVGANIGQYGSALRTDGYRGRLLSVEPLETAFRELNRRSATDPLWDCVQCAVGAQDDEAVLRVSANSYSTSLLPMTEAHAHAAPESRYRGAQPILIRTLDSVVGMWSNEVRVLALKLDVQGYEAPVLEGATNTLPRVRLLEIELSLVPLYEGQTLYMEMLDQIRDLGFSLVNMEPGFTDPRSGRVLQFDGMFLRNE